MKNAFFNTFLFTVLLASCVSQKTPTPVILQATTTSAPATSTQTATPLVIVSKSGSLLEFNEEALLAFARESGIPNDKDSQPFADQGIVKGDDGKMWLFDESTQKMMEMNNDPSWDIKSLSRGEDGNLVITLSDEKQFNFIDGKWVVVVTEKVYTSGADPELQAEIIAEAEKTFGMSIQEKIQKAIDAGIYDPGIVFNKEEGMYRGDMISLGPVFVSLKDLPGALPTDRVIILPMSENNNTDVVVPLIVEYEYKGRSYKATTFIDSERHDATRGVDDSAEHLMAFLQEAYKPGTVALVQLQTFGPFDTEEEFNSANKDGSLILPFNLDAVFKLIRLQNNDFIVRMTENNAKEAAQQLDPALGDIGLFVHLIESKTP